MSKKKLPWFPCYPEDWLDDTRGMTDTQARVYWDFLCLIYLHDGVVRSTDKWIAHELHIHIHKWRTVRKFLVADGKLVENADGSLTNNRAARVCLERKARSDAMGNLASNRELTRRVTRWESPELPFEINKGRAALCLVSDQGVAPHLHHQIIEEEKERSSEPRTSIDDDRPPRRTLSPNMVRAVEDKIGAEQAKHYIDEYLNSDFGRNAKTIDAAFSGWLRKTYGIHIDRKGAATSVGDILAMCGTDALGRPDTTLPKSLTRKRA